MRVILSHVYRCFPHIINLSVQAGLATLPSPEKIDALENKLREEGTLTSGDSRYFEALRTSLVHLTRTFVGDARAFGLRCEDLETSIKQANESFFFFFGSESSLRTDTTLLRDMDALWSSTFLMADRYLHLLPVRHVLRGVIR